MRHEKAEQLLLLARLLASSAEGMTLDEMASAMDVGRRTAERMRDGLLRLFPQMEEIPDGPAKRFRIAGGLDSFFQSPTADELSALTQAADALHKSGKLGHAGSLRNLDKKVRAAMKPPVLRKVAPDLEALLQAELIAVQAGPRPIEDEQVMVTLREALCSMRAVQFSYRSAKKPARVRQIAPYGILFGRMNYLIGPELGHAKVKSWRLDRMTHLEILAQSAPRPADFSLPQFAAASFGFFHTDQEDVVLRVLKEGVDEFDNWRFHPDQTIEFQDDGSAIVRFRASGMLELAWHLFSWQNKIQILAPASLRTIMLHELNTAVTHHHTAPAAPAGPAKIH